MHVDDITRAKLFLIVERKGVEIEHPSGLRKVIGSTHIARGTQMFCFSHACRKLALTSLSKRGSTQQNILGKTMNLVMASNL